MFRLVQPDISHQEQWKETAGEWDENWKRPRIFFQNSYDVFLEKVAKLKDSHDTESQTPKSTFFFLQDSETQKIVWFYVFRHNLDFWDDSISGGHIGYGIRPSERWKWYAKEWLRLLLFEVKKLGFEKVFISCDDDNISSAKVIEANGWILEKYTERNGVKGRRYGIDLCESKFLLEYLKCLEVELLQHETQHNPSRIDELLADDFFECWKTGDMFGKKECLEWLPQERAKKLTARDISVHMFSENLWQVRYIAEIGGDEEKLTISFRTSLWRKTEKWWQMFFHQGTLIE